jgi:hypothetical protein
MAKSKLEQLADQYRVDNLKGNTYQKDEGKKYSPTHPNALTSEGKGKGTGEYLDTYNGGSETDIKGNPNISKTGREALIAENEAKNGAVNGPNGYGPDKPYRAPDLDGEDQFIVD